MEARIPRNQAVSDRSVNTTILITSFHKTDHSTSIQIFLDIKLVRFFREHGVVIVRVQNRYGHTRGRRFRGRPVVGSNHHQVVTIVGLTVQHAAEVNPPAVGKDSKNVGVVLRAGFVCRDQSVGQSGVVTGV